MTVTTKQVHIHLQEMSSRYKKENPNLNIGIIAKEFGTTVETIQPHLDRLKSLGLVCYHTVKNTVSVKLTKKGKLFDAEL